MTEMNRTAFGAPRSHCSCIQCRTFCEYAPGYLIPEDLERMVPKDVNILEWAEQNLRASPGAIAVDTKLGKVFRVPTLVPAAKEGTNTCKFYENKRCTIYESAPFGCAFFSCTQSDKKAQHLTSNGLKTVALDWAEEGLYAQLWNHLDNKGLTAPGPETTSVTMKKETGR